METYQGHRDEINRCGETGEFKTLTQALKLLRHLNVCEPCPDRMSDSMPDLRTIGKGRRAYSVFLWNTAVMTSSHKWTNSTETQPA
jgi:hypothetical protein